HDVGDEVIKIFAKLYERTVPDAYHARLGGDEFAFFISGIERDDLALKIDTLIATVASKALASGIHSLGSFTLSIGAACLRKEDDGDSWVRRSDQFLYQSKNAGGNRSMIEKPMSNNEE
ncbi:MAG: GGDEF domain-containing protein, partial [Planctomycetota bacterium]